jgi:outer membrane protein
VRTRLGYGTGIAYASRIPFAEQRDQALRGRDTSKLLLYADPSIDFSVGDLFRVKSLRETFVGLGVSHRSGVFGTAKLFNNVDGGSNYIYGFVETSF